MADRPGALTPGPSRARIVVRHMLLAALPIACGLGAGVAFDLLRDSCTQLVGLLLAPICRGRQLEIQIQFQLWGTVAGCVLAATLGIWLELRRRRAAARREPPGPSAV